MNRARRAVLAATAAIAALAVACSNHPATTSKSSVPSAETGCPYLDPVAAAALGAPGASACSACLAEQCAPELEAYASGDGCGEYISCVCPGGVVSADAGQVAACQSSAVEPACAQAVVDVDVCASEGCSAACNPSPSSFVDSGTDASPIGGGGLVDASLSPACAAYAACCDLALGGEDAGVPSTIVQTDCIEEASLLTDAQCDAYIVAYQDAGVACAAAP
jgi:hypothetical protein